LAATDEIRECLQNRLRRVVENGENAES